jgi:hypothetical protein
VCIYPYHPVTLDEEVTVSTDVVDSASLQSLATYDGEKLAQVACTPALGSRAFQRTKNGEIEIRPLQGASGPGGSITLPAPKAVPPGRKLVLELVFTNKAWAGIDAQCGGVTKSIIRSDSDPDFSEQFVFPSALAAANGTITMRFDIKRGGMMSLKQISIYSAK